MAQATSLRGYGGILSSGGLNAMCKVLFRDIMSGHYLGLGGGVAKIHREPPS